MATTNSKNLIYSSPSCPYCVQAKKVLDSLGVQYEEINLMNTPDKREEMLERSGGRSTVPQIFIGNFHVGGYDDLIALKKAGQLEKILDNSNKMT